MLHEASTQPFSLFSVFITTYTVSGFLEHLESTFNVCVNVREEVRLHSDGGLTTSFSALTLQEAKYITVNVKQ